MGLAYIERTYNSTTSKKGVRRDKERGEER
jgi:hypothetical protein